MGLMVALKCLPPDERDQPDTQVNIITGSAAMRQGWLRTRAQGTDYRKRWDGLWKQCLEEWLGKIKPANIHGHKVKAHRQASDGIDETDTRWIHGNSVADGVANRCLEEHMYHMAGNQSADARKAGKNTAGSHQPAGGRKGGARPAPKT